MTRKPAKGHALVLAAVLVLLAVGGEAGHVLLDQLNAVTAHHFFHIVFPLVAFAVFAGFAANDIRLRGWPTFSWRLDARPSRSRPRASGPSSTTVQVIRPPL